MAAAFAIEYPAARESAAFTLRSSPNGGLRGRLDGWRWLTPERTILGRDLHPHPEPWMPHSSAFASSRSLWASRRFSRAGSSRPRRSASQSSSRSRTSSITASATSASTTTAADKRSSSAFCCACRLGAGLRRSLVGPGRPSRCACCTRRWCAASSLAARVASGLSAATGSASGPGGTSSSGWSVLGDPASSRSQRCSTSVTAGPDGRPPHDPRAKAEGSAPPLRSRFPRPRGCWHTARLPLSAGRRVHVADLSVSTSCPRWGTQGCMEMRSSRASCAGLHGSAMRA
jgi:hypothetical protein